MTAVDTDVPPVVEFANSTDEESGDLPTLDSAASEAADDAPAIDVPEDAAAIEGTEVVEDFGEEAEAVTDSADEG